MTGAITLLLEGIAFNLHSVYTAAKSFQNGLYG